MEDIYFSCGNFGFKDGDRIVEQVLRDPKKSLDIVLRARNCQQKNEKSKSIKLLKSIGLISISPLWELGIFRKNFFRRFGICYLHLSLEGNMKRHLEYLAMKHGPVWWKGIINIFFLKLILI